MFSLNERFERNLIPKSLIIVTEIKGMELFEYHT